jgi:protein farnesyltransferase subunit beta
MADLRDFPAKVPYHFLQMPPLQDELTTPSSEVQDDTLAECLPLLRAAGDPSRSPFDFNEFGLPELRREDHIDFLHENLSQFPAPFVGLDASRPWLAYWGLMGLYFLGEEVTIMRRRYVPDEPPYLQRTSAS